MSAATKAKISAALKARAKRLGKTPKPKKPKKKRRPPRHHRIEVQKGKPTTPGRAISSGTTVRSMLKRRAKRK